MSSSPNPIAVLPYRGKRIESWHRAAYAIADPSGRLVHAAGDVSCPIYPRSAVKPLQALALLESGAAEQFSVSDAELALACASHSGEPRHVDQVLAWLARLGLDQSALECGAHPPMHAASADRVRAGGQAFSAVHNNCSGKHAGMLTLATALGAPISGYTHPDHPVQQRIRTVLAEMAGAETLPPPAIDGCGVPTYPMPLTQLAAAMARLADPSGLAPVRAAACFRVRTAMINYPDLIAGTGRVCTAIMTNVPNVIVKTGAEGVYAAALPGRKLGLALKVDDGAGRAASVALLALLNALQLLDEKARDVLSGLARPRPHNHAGRPIGRLEPAADWPDLIG